MADMEWTMSDRTNAIADELLKLKNANGVINPTEAVAVGAEESWLTTTWLIGMG